MTTNSQANLISALRTLFGHLTSRRRKQLVLVLLLMLGGAVAELMALGAIMPFLTLMANPGSASSLPFLKDLVSALGWKNPDSLLLPATLLFVFAALFAGAFRILMIWASQKFIFRVGYDLSVDVYRRTLYQPYNYHVSKNSGELIAGIHKVQTVIGGVLSPIMHIVMSLILTIFILSALIVIDAKVALTAAGGFALIYLGITYATRKRLFANSQVIAETQNERIKTLQEGYGGVRDVIIDQAQPVYVDKFGHVDLIFRDAQMINKFIGEAPVFAIQALALVLIAGLAYSLSLSPGGLISALPVLGALALGAQRLMPMVQLIYQGVTRISGNRHVLWDVLELLELPANHIDLVGSKIEPLPFEHKITLDKIDFRYTDDGPLVLNDVSLTVGKGSRIGLIGKTGSGKSTIIDLVMGLLEPTSGSIKIDENKLTRDNVHRWQTRVAHVPQAIYLSDTSIAENIAFGIPPEDIDIEQVKSAARRAEIAEHIESLRDGYETFIGERGIRLSGGQRQRIGIARALYKEADVLVFDEATSALDSNTEEAVMEAIRSLDENLTIFIIAHRLSTIEHCDKVVRLEAGRIVAEGPYDDVVSELTDEKNHIQAEKKLHAS